MVAERTRAVTHSARRRKGHILKGVGRDKEWPYEPCAEDTGVLEATGHAQREPRSKALSSFHVRPGGQDSSLQQSEIQGNPEVVC